VRAVIQVKYAVFWRFYIFDVFAMNRFIVAKTTFKSHLRSPEVKYRTHIRLLPTNDP